MTPPPRSEYARLATVFGALIALTALTGVAARIDLGAWNLAVAFAIAGVKAGAVLLVFMQLRREPWLTWILAGSGVLFFAVLLLMALADRWTR